MKLTAWILMLPSVASFELQSLYMRNSVYFWDWANLKYLFSTFLYVFMWRIRLFLGQSNPKIFVFNFSLCFYVKNQIIFGTEQPWNIFFQLSSMFLCEESDYFWHSWASRDLKCCRGCYWIYCRAYVFMLHFKWWRYCLALWDDIFDNFTLFD